MNIVKSLVAMLGIGFFSPFLQASNTAFYCVVDLKKVLIYGSGVVNVLHSGKDDYTHICNLKTERQGVSVATCAMWASFLLDVEKNNDRAIFYYNKSAGYDSCMELPTYGGAPAPVYIGNAD